VRLTVFVERMSWLSIVWTRFVERQLLVVSSAIMGASGIVARDRSGH